jgi:serine protease Do
MVMKYFVCIFLSILFLFQPEVRANSQSKYDSLFQEFDARSFNYNEKRMIQLALALSGDYRGLLDGKWGRISQTAFEQYTRKKFSLEPINFHLASLFSDFIDEMDVNDWETNFDPRSNLSFLLPFKRMRDTPEFKNDSTMWSGRTTSLIVSTWKHRVLQLRANHQSILRSKSRYSEVFEVRNKDRWVTAVSDKDDVYWYIRSEKIGFTWSTVLISAQKDENHLLDIVASSVEVGRPSDYSLRDKRALDQIIKLSVDYVNSNRRGSESVVGEAKEPPEAKPNNVNSSGTGFYINSDGKIVTNHHVVDGCSEVKVNGYAASIDFKSEEFDIAVIHADKASRQSQYIKLSPDAARLNSDVTVAGFPYNGLLTSLNITRGAVSSLKGIGGDAKYIQISAPVQPGNSGGPAVNEFGNLVGVVAARISASAVVELTGTLPENINFAVKPAILRLLLDSNGIEYSVGDSQKEIKPVDLADKLADAVVLIECNS